MQEQLASNVAKVQQHEEHLEAAEARVWEWNGFVDRIFFFRLVLEHQYFPQIYRYLFRVNGDVGCCSPW